jgi:hypothetical protein
MPILGNEEDMAGFQGGAGFKFSGTKFDKLAATGAGEYTLVGIACDRSTSVESFAAEIEGCLKTSLEGCQRSPRVDNLLMRLLGFNRKPVEEHGFLPLAECHLAKYDGFLKPGGMTALFDASVDIIDSLAAYGKDLISRDYEVNGLVVIITDGDDTASTLKAHDVKAAAERARKTEVLESLITILIGVNVTDPHISQYLKAFTKEGGFNQYIEAKDASPKTFARIANFIGASVSSQSQAVGSKAPSAPINF